jgi:type II secretory pathway component PulM
MSILAVLSEVLAVGLASLAIVYYFFRQSAMAQKAQLEKELQELTDRSAQIQTHLETQLSQTREALQTNQREKAELENQVEALKQQCSRLRKDLEQQAQQVQADTQRLTFEQLQTLLTQYPTVRCMAAAKADLPAKNLVALFTSLDNLLQFWGYEAIGQPWQAANFDPQIHQGDIDGLKSDEKVYVRFVGYRHAKSKQIQIPAKVSRTLPAGVDREAK